MVAWSSLINAPLTQVNSYVSPLADSSASASARRLLRRAPGSPTAGAMAEPLHRASIRRILTTLPCRPSQTYQRQGACRTKLALLPC